MRRIILLCLTSCWPDKFRCLDHTCVDVKHRCDGIWDCVAGEDELSCDTSHCPAVGGGGGGGGWQFACRDRRQCINRSGYCDGERDCEDGSDEMRECGCHRNGQFACGGGGGGEDGGGVRECVSRLKVCDGERDCGDGSDEAGCNSIR